MIARLALALVLLIAPAAAQTISGPAVQGIANVGGLVQITSPIIQFLPFGGSPQLQTGYIPGASEYFDAMGGLTGNGATLLATNGGAGSVSANYAAQESGGHFFGNGSGYLLELDDPGAPSVAWLRATPAISGGRSKLDTTAGGWQLDLPNSVSSIITQNGQTLAEFGTTGSAATAANWMRFTSNASFATMQCAGTVNASCYIQAAGTGSIIYANSSGTFATFANSIANTAAQALQVRAASTTQPEMLQVTGGNIAIGGAAGNMAAVLANSATAGFPGIPTVAGVPTGVPTQAEAGVAYLVYDSTNLKLCAYVSSWKCSAAFQ